MVVPDRNPASHTTSSRTLGRIPVVVAEVDVSDIAKAEAASAQSPGYLADDYRCLDLGVGAAVGLLC